MTKELTTTDDFTRQLAELDQIQRTCKNLMQTPHYAKLGEFGIHAIIARAKALGLHPFEALNGGFYVVNGKVGMSTEMMAALIRRRGHSVTKDPKSNGECVILHGKRADNGDIWTCAFTRQDAEAAGLWGTATWKKYAAVMLYNRCMSMLFRQLFPDLSLGAGYVEDELHEITKTGDYAKPIDIPVENLEHVKPLYIPNSQSSEELGEVPVFKSEMIKKDKPNYEIITEYQVKELGNYLDECDPKFKENVFEFIKIKSNNRFEGLEFFPVRSYVETLKKAQENREEFIAKQKADFETQRVTE